jgi:hypothetical protein
MSRRRNASESARQAPGDARTAANHRTRALVLPALAAPVVVVLALTGCSGRSTLTVEVDQGPFEKIHLVDLGDPGPSAGDIRVFTGKGTSTGNTPVRTDWELVTIDHSDTSEIRNARATFVFGDGTDQLVFAGSATYPVGGGTLDKGVVVRRAVLGGTGRYAGATGWVETTHKPDDTWTHVFHLTLP